MLWWVEPKWDFPHSLLAGLEVGSGTEHNLLTYREIEWDSPTAFPVKG